MHRTRLRVEAADVAAEEATREAAAQSSLTSARLSHILELLTRRPVDERTDEGLKTGGALSSKFICLDKREDA